MSDINPYQAPQTIATATLVSGPEFELGPEFLVVSQGARHCYTAVVTLLLTVVFFIVFGMILGFLGGLIFVALPIIVSVCAVLHLLGMRLMSKIDPASRAPGLLTAAAVLFGIYFTVSAVLFVLQLTKSLDASPAWVELPLAVINCASNILLMIALKRIGEYVQYPQITSKANSALWGLVLMYGALIIYLALLILTGLGLAPALGNRGSLSSLTLIMGIAMFVLAIYALSSYSTAVSLIGKLQQIKLAVKNFQTPLQLSNDINVPTPGQEMDFLK
jgi:hypothetical protein